MISKDILKDFQDVQVGTYFKLENGLRLLKTERFQTILGKRCNSVLVESGSVQGPDGWQLFEAGRGYTCEPWESCEVKVLNV